MDLDRALGELTSRRSLRAVLLGPGRTMLCETLGSMIGPTRSLRTCRLRRTHFKPGRKLTGYYAVTLGGSRQPIPVAVSWFLGGPPECGPEFAAAQKQLQSDGMLTGFDQLFAIEPSCRMLVQAAPFDPTFPGLGPLSDPRRGPDAAGGNHDSKNRSFQVRPVRYRPGQRHVLEYRLRATPGLFVKLYRPGEHRPVADAVTTLAEALDVSGVLGVRAVRPTTVLAGMDAIVYPHAPGTPLSRMVRAGQPVRSDHLHQVGRLLRGIHSYGQPLAPTLRQRSLADEIRAIDRACEAMQVLGSDLRSVAASVVDRARERLEGIEQEPPTVVHGDMKSDHLLIGTTGIAVLDADRCALADPAFDLGKLLADLRWWSWASAGNDTVQAEAAVLTGYGAHGPRLARARLYAALMLVKIAARRISVTDLRWARHTKSLLDLAVQASSEEAAA